MLLSFYGFAVASILVSSENSAFSFCVLKAYQMRGAGAVIHSHGIETCIASMLEPGAKEFRVIALVQASFFLSGLTCETNINLNFISKTRAQRP